MVKENTLGEDAADKTHCRKGVFVYLQDWCFIKYNWSRLVYHHRLTRVDPQAKTVTSRERPSMVSVCI